MDNGQTKQKSKRAYFSMLELALWIGSACVIAAAFFVFDGKNFLAFVASLVGVTALIFNAKGNPAGQALMIAFSVIYGIISYSCAYYGEMLTYLAMTAPMAAMALIDWLRHPSGAGKSEVKINRVRGAEYIFALALSLAVTAAFYFVLRHFNTARLAWSTVSVFTSFAAAYLTFRRSPAFALAYAANDLVLIVLWSFATAENRGYISVLVCFCVFFANDIYGFLSWRKIQKRQNREKIYAEKI